MVALAFNGYLGYREAIADHEPNAPGVTVGWYKGHPPALRRCPSCDGFFTFYRGYNDNKKYCSSACCQKAYRKRHQTAPKIVDRSYGSYLGQCPGCGKDVWGTNKRQQYCPGSKCRVAALRKRRAAAVDQSLTERSLPIT
jgi:hypothetical protein